MQMRMANEFDDNINECNFFQTSFLFHVLILLLLPCDADCLRETSAQLKNEPN